MSWLVCAIVCVCVCVSVCVCVCVSVCAATDMVCWSVVTESGSVDFEAGSVREAALWVTSVLWLLWSAA